MKHFLLLNRYTEKGKFQYIIQSKDISLIETVNDNFGQFHETRIKLISLANDKYDPFIYVKETPEEIYKMLED